MEVLEKIVKELKNCVVEATVTRVASENVRFENNSFTKAGSGEKNKLEVRVTKGERSAYAWTNNLSKWKELALRAKKLMQASSPLKKAPVISKSPPIKKSFTHASIKEVGIDTLKSKGQEVISAANALKVNVAGLTITKELSTKSFLNSENTTYFQEQSEVVGEVECTLENSSAWDFRTSQDLNIDFAELGKSTAGICRDSLKPKKIAPGLFDVVLDYQALTNILNILLPSLLANNVLEHNSFFEGKIGQQLISPLLTISDKGVMPGGTNNSVRDAEGTPTKDKEVFTKGTLNYFFNDLYTASRLSVPATGNSAGLLKRGLISSNNIIIESGSASREELLSNCVYINNLMGSHTANTVSGDFALNALNAFSIKNDKWVPLRDIMLAGNIFDLLKKVSIIGKESRFDASLKAPLIKFKNAQLVG